MKAFKPQPIFIQINQLVTSEIHGIELSNNDLPAEQLLVSKAKPGVSQYIPGVHGVGAEEPTGQ